MYALIRADLEMPAGKLSAQAGHAYTDALYEAPRNVQEAYKGTGSKVTIQCKNLGQLERAYRECIEAGLPCAIVTDEKHILLPHFDGSPVVTALGIGPCTKAECRHITKRFQSVK